MTTNKKNTQREIKTGDVLQLRGSILDDFNLYGVPTVRFSLLDHDVLNYELFTLDLSRVDFDKPSFVVISEAYLGLCKVMHIETKTRLLVNESWLLENTVTVNV